jgi:hypothetical protein
MQTGWRHKDHEAQREFERITKKASVATAVETPAVTTPAAASQTPGVVANVRDYDLQSSLNTISVATQKTANKTVWDIERFLTVSTNNVEVATRIYGAYQNNFRFDTVKRIDFQAGDNIDVHGEYVEEDHVRIFIHGNAPSSSSLEGALSTVWIKDAAADPAVGFGYDTGSGTYLNELYVGPWGWHTNNAATPPDPTPYNLSGYSNNAKDTQWDWGFAARANGLQAYTRFGKVSKSGLYHISGTTQGYRWVSNECAASMIQFINTRIHYYLVVNRPLGDAADVRIYKSLDIEPWDMWAFGILNTVESRTAFVNQMSSRPWGVQGTAQIWLNAGDEVSHYITYNGGTGEKRVGYQVTYHAFEGICVADETTLDPTTQVNLDPINKPDGYLNYHQMQFINV